MREYSLTACCFFLIALFGRTLWNHLRGGRREGEPHKDLRSFFRDF